MNEPNKDITIKRLGNIYGDWGTGYAGNCWSTDHLCPTLKVESGGGGRVPMIIEDTLKVKELGFMDNGTGKHQSNTVYDINHISPCVITVKDGGTIQIKILTGNEKEDIEMDEPISTNGSEISGTIRATYYKNGERNIAENVEHGRGYEGVIEPVIVASRGRNPDDPSDRTAGIHLEQRLEINESGTTNSLTTVAKDNWILEPQEAKPRYRIRKLTPNEVWRLMSFNDEDFNKAKAINSNTTLYRQAGNAIVKNVLMALLSQFEFEGHKKWNDMTKEERYKLLNGKTTNPRE